MESRVLILICFVWMGSWAKESNRRLPEEDMNATELIKNQGFPAELHSIVTQDGYILGCQRIPHGRNNKESIKNRPPILLLHGLDASSTTWITNLANQSLAFILADEGYDVWLGNNRGNVYSASHVKYKIHSKEFWDFTWEEMAEYDIPAMVNYILNATGYSQLYYVGHSQGTLIAFAKFSTDTQFAKKIKMFAALAPISTLGHITSRVRIFAPFADAIYYVFKLFGERSTSDLSWILDYVKPICDDEKIDKLLCENILFYLLGSEDTKLLNQTRVPIFIAHNPAGTSMKNMAHFGQMVNSKKMQRFDYGFFGNKNHYQQRSPPEFDVSKMELDTVVFWSKQDSMADSVDVAKLLPKIRKGRSFIVDDYSHIDFLFAMNARQHIYNPLIKILKDNPL